MKQFGVLHCSSLVFGSSGQHPADKMAGHTHISVGNTTKHKRVLGVVLGLCLLGAAGCGDDTAPSNLPIVMTATLLPSNEVPPIANAENTGHGAVQITFNVTRDGTGAITGGTADFHFQLAGYPSSTTIIAAHIHPGPAGVNGAVLVNTGLLAASPVTQTNGVMSFTATGVSVTAANLQNIVNNPAAFYFNVHSPTNPGGVSRGQLTRTQ